MTNKEKAAMLSGMALGFSDGITKEKYNIALEMSQWKDEQFAAEKQALIDKACEILEIRLVGCSMSKVYFDCFITRFRKAMEETK